MGLLLNGRFCRSEAINQALVAQWIEHLTTDQKVVGSTPAERTSPWYTVCCACETNGIPEAMGERCGGRRIDTGGRGRDSFLSCGHSRSTDATDRYRGRNPARCRPKFRGDAARCRKHQKRFHIRPRPFGDAARDCCVVVVPSGVVTLLFTDIEGSTRRRR